MFTPLKQSHLTESPIAYVTLPQAVNYPYVEDGTLGRSGTLTRSTHTQVVADSPGAVIKEHMLYIWNPEFEVRCPFRPPSSTTDQNSTTTFAQCLPRELIHDILTHTHIHTHTRTHTHTHTVNMSLLTPSTMCFFCLLQRWHECLVTLKQKVLLITEYEDLRMEVSAPWCDTQLTLHS